MQEKQKRNNSSAAEKAPIQSLLNSTFEKILSKMVQFSKMMLDFSLLPLLS
jgi:hypothetical protein